MTRFVITPVIVGLVVAVIVALWVSRQQRGTITRDELSERLTLGAGATAFPALMTIIAVLWIRDLSRAADAAAIRTSPYTLLLIAGCGIWIAALAIQQWRTGVLDFGSGSAWWYVLSFGLLGIGFLPFRWVAPVQFIGAVVGLVAAAILFRCRRAGN
jgi:hypothetical protein